jgi:hypothetical protein
MSYPSNPLSPSRAASFACTSDDPRTRRTTDGDRSAPSGHHSFRLAVSEAMDPSTEETYVGQSRCAWLSCGGENGQDSYGARPKSESYQTQEINPFCAHVLTSNMVSLRVHSSCPSHMGVL